jgi:hypothetical protein
MMRHVRDYRQVARREGAECVSCLHGGKHLRMTLEYDGGRFELVIPATPSDRRGRNNFQAEVRRRVKRREAA